jgi:hypothetical protein
MPNVSKNIKELIRIAEQQQWVCQRRTKHYCFIPPDKSKPAVIVSGGSSDKAYRDVLSDLRRSGLVLR